MSAHDSASHPRVVTAISLLLPALLFCASAWIGHDVRPWTIRLTNYLFAACLLSSYVSGWIIALVWAAAARRRMAFRAAGTSVVLLVLLLLLEIPAAVGLIDYSHIWSMVTGEWSGPATNFESDYDLGFKHPPHSYWSGRPRSDMAVNWNLPIRSPVPMTFSTDSKGFRNLHETDRTDIALLGDSYVEGAYVSDDETCAVRLQELSGCSVTNLAQAGYGTLQELEVLSRYALPLRPRMVAWFFFEGNDLYNDQAFEDSLPYLREHGTYESPGLHWSWHEFWGRSFSCTTFQSLRRAVDPLVPNNVATFGLFRDGHGQVHRLYFYDDATISFDEFERLRFERTKEAFRHGRTLCKENGIQLVVFYIPMKFRVYAEYCTFPPESPCRAWIPWCLADRFREFCERDGIPYVDLTDSMKEAARSGIVLYAPEDTHWNQAGHRFVAERLHAEWDHYRLEVP